MAKPFDATTKSLLTTEPSQLLAYLGLGEGHLVEVLNVDLSTVTAEADAVLGVADPEPWIAHVEFQASPDRDLGRRLLRYNVLIGHDRAIPVRSVALLLRPEADGPSVTGRVERFWPGGERYLDFRYDVVRAWQQPVEAILNGGLGMLPLAPIAAVSRADLPAVIHRLRDRLANEATPNQARTLWASTYVLMGLLYNSEESAQLLKGVRDMEESSTYQAILKRGIEQGRAEGRNEGRAEGRNEGRAEGRAEALSESGRLALLLVGRSRLGDPDPETRLAIDAVTDPAEIERLVTRVLSVVSWKELFAGS